MRSTFRLAGVLCCGLLLSTSAALPAAAPAAPQPGNTQGMNAMWNLTDLYPTPEAWTEAYTRTKADAEKLESFKGTLGQSAASMRAALDAISNVRRSLY